MTLVRAVERRCACGGAVGPSGECAACRRRRLERVGARPAAFPTRLAHGHDFSRVPVHFDGAGQAGKAKCKEFPGGSTDCEIDSSTGTPTGRVTTKVDETNPCTRPCVEKHEAVHVKQMQKLCPALRDCYAAADKGKLPVSECFTLAIGNSARNECEAYNVSVPCVAQRLRSALECKSPAGLRYGAEKLESEICWRDHFCGSG